MKKAFLTSVLMAILPIWIMAHPAKSVSASYNAQSSKLKISVLHPVKDVSTHYIITVTIIVDGKEVKVLKYTKQTNTQTLEDEVAIPEIKKGSKVEVKTKCNKFGNKSVSIVI